METDAPDGDINEEKVREAYQKLTDAKRFHNNQPLFDDEETQQAARLLRVALPEFPHKAKTDE